MSENSKAIANGDSQSLRGFLRGLSPEQILCLSVKREDYLLSALSARLEEEKRFPVVVLTDPESGKRTVANVFANREILRAAIHHITDAEQAAEQFRTLNVVQQAPVQECVTLDTDVNVLNLPVFRHFEGDAGRYITSGIVFARDPDNGRYNMSFHRMQLKGRNKIGISLHSRGDLYRYYQRAQQLGCDLEIAVVIGTHPAYYIAGASKIPLSQDDYNWAGAYLGETPIVTQAKTVDLLIPAFAEYVLEGRILKDTFEDEGPFGEYTGYSTSRSTRNVFEVSAVTHRKDAIYQDLVPGYAWEHLLLSQFTKEVILLEKLQREIPEVTALNMPKNGCHFHAYVSMKPKARGQAKQVMLLLFGLDLYLKFIVVVNDDVDVYNEEEVLWAMATHVQADTDVFIVPEVLCNRLDPSSHDGMSAKMGVDATGKENQETSRVTLPEEIQNKAKRILSDYVEGDYNDEGWSV